MPAMEPLCHILGVNSKKLSLVENFILEGELFIHICKEVNEVFKSHNKEYFRILKLDGQTECAMIESNFIRALINDIVASEAYTLPGIAYYTQTPEDVICDLVTSPHPHPILSLPRKIIELHRGVRPDLYNEIIKKIINQ